MSCVSRVVRMCGSGGGLGLEGFALVTSQGTAVLVSSFVTRTVLRNRWFGLIDRPYAPCRQARQLES